MIYQIVRFFFSGEPEPRQTFETLEEAQEWCKREDTHGDYWFDGYREVDECCVIPSNEQFRCSMTKALDQIYRKSR